MEIFQDPIDFSELQLDPDGWKKSHFYAIAAPWRALGYAVIPSDGPRSKIPLQGHSWRQWCGEGRQPVPEDLFRHWCLRYRDHEGLLLGDSSTGGLPDLVIVDADDPEVFSWVGETFGPTPKTVESGRAGGGRHHYYQARPGVRVPQRNGCIGPTQAFVWVADPEEPRKGRWKAPIDVKSSRSYVCVEGTIHKTGLTYLSSQPPTREAILALPVFDDALYEHLARTCKPQGRPGGEEARGTPVGASRGTRGTSTSTYTRIQASGDAIIPGPGLMAGRSVSEAAALLGVGARLEVGCPWHHSVSGRSATLRVLDNGSWRISCHVEGTTYEPARVRPQTVEERDHAEDLVVPPTVELQMQRLIRDRRYSEALEIADQQSVLSEDVYAQVLSALEGEEGLSLEARREADVQAARADAWDLYEARIAKKTARARSVPRPVREGAERALKLALTLLGAVQARRAEIGLPLYRPRDAGPCGVPLALQSGLDATLLGVRICRDEDCPTHGPITQARRIAAAIAMPLVKKDRVGPALGARDLWEWSVPKASWPGFLRLYAKTGVESQKTELRENSAHHIDIENRDAEFSLKYAAHQKSEPVHGYLACDPGTGTLTVLTTCPLPLQTGRRGRPSQLAGIAPREVPAAQAAERIVALGLQALRARDLFADLEGSEGERSLQVVRGTITSSQTLHLDPEGTARLAQASPWVAIGEVPVVALRDALRDAGVATGLRDAGTSGERLTAHDVAPQKALAAVVAAGGRLYTPESAVDEMQRRREREARERLVAEGITPYAPAPPGPSEADILADIYDDHRSAV